MQAGFTCQLLLCANTECFLRTTYQQAQVIAIDSELQADPIPVLLFHDRCLQDGANAGGQAGKHSLHVVRGFSSHRACIWTGRIAGHFKFRVQRHHLPLRRTFMTRKNVSWRKSWANSVERRCLRNFRSNMGLKCETKCSSVAGSPCRSE
jgi:hypothetical protein